ncbi:MAG: Adenine deaminase [Planctomycetota bacterium]|jgi:adenine deaminase
MSTHTSHHGQIVDVVNKRIYPGVINVVGGKIVSIREDSTMNEKSFLAPGFIDAHIHIESSLLSPQEFARIAVIHGTIGTVSDPHEIANVLGVEGIRYMQRMANQTPLKIHYGIPSCVPATRFESAGATIDSAAVEQLCHDKSLLYLSEVMNYPDVICGDAETIRKLSIAQDFGKMIDGHAPGLRGKDLETYIAAGIQTDHECFELEEALEKEKLGLKILIREGSAAKNFEALWPMLTSHPRSCMLCSDDKHPYDLLKGHINQLCARAVAYGVPLFHVLQAACINPVQHYGLTCGMLRVGDAADFVRLDDLTEFQVLETWINGELVAQKGVSLLPKTNAPCLNRFETSRKSQDSFAVRWQDGSVRVIEARDGSLITGSSQERPLRDREWIIADPSRDILKIAVVNRYRDTLPAVGFVRGIGLQCGAIASSIAHDCHNIVAVGCSDESLAQVVNLVIAKKGGIAVVSPGQADAVLPLPIAGLMSDRYAEQVAEEFARLTHRVQQLGSPLQAPFMTLSFLALLVIPELKISDLGLFDGQLFKQVSLYYD